jgi:hypothetical protein
MRNGLIGLVGTVVLASTMAVAGCSDSSSGATGTGGTTSTSGGSSSTGGNATTSGGQNSSGGSSAAVGGSSSVGGGTSCTNVTPCGGNVVGTWSATSSCLTVTGQVDLTRMGIGCTTATVTGTLHVTGTWTANADGTVSDNTTTTGDENLELPASCLNVSGTTTTCPKLARSFSSLGLATATCADAASGGGCSCTATVEQSGGIAVVSTDATNSLTYTTASNVITTSDGLNQTPYSYCVAGSTLTMSPQATSTTSGGTVTGTIVLQKQ